MSNRRYQLSGAFVLSASMFLTSCNSATSPVPTASAPAEKPAPAPEPPACPNCIPVTADNFIRAETDKTFVGEAKLGAFGKFVHFRDMAPINNQVVQRGNRDTLYSTAVFDLDAGPVTITLPNAGKRFETMIFIDEDH